MKKRQNFVEKISEITKYFSRAKNSNWDRFGEKCMKFRINSDDNLPLRNLYPQSGATYSISF